MAKKSIKSRYSIEYAYPDASSKSVNMSYKKWPLIVGGVLVLSGLASAVIPFKSIESYVVSTFKSSTSDTKEFINREISTALVDEVQLENPTEPFIDVVNDEPAVIKKEELTEVLNDLNSDFLVVGSNSAPDVEDVEVTESEEVVDVIEIDVEKLLLDNKKHQEASQEQLLENQELTQKLNELSQQLMAEKDKNEKLNAQISAQENNNNKLASLLDDALKNASNEDQKYISELDDLNASIPVFNSEHTTKQQEETTGLDLEIVAINDQVAKLVPTVSSKKIDYNNSIGVSTASQVDAIVIAMQEIQHSKSVTEEKPSIQKNSVSVGKFKKADAESTEELLHLRLQRQINQLLYADDKKTNNYKEALVKESEVRSNAMRSITVKKGETLWSIAERAYGNGSLYTKIVEANPHITKNGKVVLSIGQVIRVPI